MSDAKHTPTTLKPCSTCGGTTGFVKNRGTLDVCDDPWHDEHDAKHRAEAKAEGANTPTRRRLPLSVYHDGKSICDGDGHVMTVESDGTTEAEDREFAAFIVRACNAHDALVAALETLCDYAREAAALNDADHVRGNAVKAHKMLLALAGLSPRYDARIDRA